MLRTVVLCFALSGCSFVLVSGPPANHAQLPAFDCTTSKVGPILDTIWTVLQTLNLAVALKDSDQEWHDMYTNDPTMDPPIKRSTAIPLYIGLAGLGAAGMYYGFSRTGECREAKAELAGRTQQPNGGGMQPGTWPPPGQPGYPPAGGQPGYPPAGGQPGYPPAQPAPGRPSPGYPPAQPQPTPTP